MASFTLVCAAIVLAAVSVSAHDCSHPISEHVNGDLHVKGGTCYLKHGAVVNGTVYLTEGANLHSRGEVHILGAGGINGRSNGWLDVAGALTVRQIDLFKCKGVSLYDAKVTNGELKVEACKGDGVICGSSINDVLEWKENTGNFYAQNNWWGVKGWWGCSENKYFRDFKIEFLTGNVKIVDQELETGELYIKGVTGSVYVKDVEATKMKFEKNLGEVYLDDIEGYEVDIKENLGTVKLYDSEFDKINCVGNGDLIGNDNEFKLGDGQCRGPSLEENGFF